MIEFGYLYFLDIIMTVNELITELNKVSLDAKYKFTHPLFVEDYYINSYYSTGTSFIIRLDFTNQYSLNRFRNILYLQRNMPIEIKTNDPKIIGKILAVDYDENKQELIITFE